jgi:hypothetical protein
MGPYENAPPDNPPGEEGSSLAARRAKLRGSLAKAVLPPDQYTPATAAAGITPPPELQNPAPDYPPAEPDPTAALYGEPSQEQAYAGGGWPAQEPYPQETYQQEAYQQEAYQQEAYQQETYQQAAYPQEPYQESPYPQDTFPQAAYPQADYAQQTAPADPLGAGSGPALELLTNIDQAMSACATNLAALQKIAGEQTDVLKTLGDTLQNQTLFEIGLNLNSLTDSLSAALEPMKAVGELVPAIDQLVVAMEAREAGSEKVSPDQLVTNLADQLSTGQIDPWTFKCAYTAVFPDDHPADLLRRLVELLGTQRLSGDLFRAAYEAVQAAEPPPRPAGSSNRGDEGARVETVVQVVQDEEIKKQLEELRSVNEQLRASLVEREGEFEQLLAAKDEELQHKDAELQEIQELLNNRYNEFQTRYEEVTEALNKREEEYQALIENKDISLREKESEAKLLREQMEELRSQTEDMVKELSKQMTDVKIAKEAASPNPMQPAKPSPPASFFDTAPQQPRSASLFDAAPDKPLFAPEPEPAPQPAPQPVAPQPQPQPVAPQPAMQPQPQPVVPQPMAPTPAPITPARITSTIPVQSGPSTGGFAGSGTGSYGHGVRAQVFEVIVRQALAGAPWREICAGPMQVNNITPDEVESEVKRRQAMLNK